MMCTVDGCDREPYVRGLCHRHYSRWWKYGDPETTRGTPTGEPMEFLVRAIQTITDDCILYPYGAATYARVRYRGNRRQAHQVALLLSGQPQPPAPCDNALHSCDVPRCVNPRHLRWGTTQDNVKDKVTRGRMVRGSGTQASRLSEADIPIIRDRFAAGQSKLSLATEFGVSHKTIRNIISGRTWSHVIHREAALTAIPPVP